jgi:hypothetical protein
MSDEKQQPSSVSVTSEPTTVNVEKEVTADAPATPTTPIKPEISEFSNIDHDLSKRVTRKIDIRLVPMLGLMYLIAFLDRTNIANAKLNGFEKDLGMPDNGYNTALWVFFLSFVLLEVPSNLLLSWQKIKPNQWLGAMMFLLGKLTLAQFQDSVN